MLSTCLRLEESVFKSFEIGTSCHLLMTLVDVPDELIRIGAFKTLSKESETWEKFYIPIFFVFYLFLLLIVFGGVTFLKIIIIMH